MIGISESGENEFFEFFARSNKSVDGRSRNVGTTSKRDVFQTGTVIGQREDGSISARIAIIEIDRFDVETTILCDGLNGLVGYFDAVLEINGLEMTTLSTKILDSLRGDFDGSVETDL